MPNAHRFVENQRRRRRRTCQPLHGNSKYISMLLIYVERFDKTHIIDEVLNVVFTDRVIVTETTKEIQGTI